MKMRLKFFYVILILMLSQGASYGQKSKDTIALIKQFNEVLAFTVQPYLYYRNTTILSANPIIQVQDTMRLQGEFYKLENDFYYKNNMEEYYLQDSLQIQVNHEDKSIMINKVEVSTKGNINLLPLNNKNMQALFKQKYIIMQQALGKNMASINVQTKQAINEGMQTTFNCGITYNTKNNLPTILLMHTTMTQNITEEDAQSILQDEQQKKMLKKLGDDYSIEREQTIKIAFDVFYNTKEKAMLMPIWQTIISFNALTKTFKGLNQLADYEITKTF